jgi:hypothetical protein
MSLWRNGYLWVENCIASPETNQKISHYLLKGIHDPRLNGSHRYLRSHNLQKSIHLIGEEADSFIEMLHPNGMYKTESYSHESKYFGTVKYEAYFLPIQKWGFSYERIRSLS